MRLNGKITTNTKHHSTYVKNEQQTKENDCNSLNWDIKICLKDKNVIQLFANKSEQEVLDAMTKFIKMQSNEDTYVSYQKDNQKNLWELWHKYPNQASIYFVYHLIGICNPNISLAIKSLKSNESGWSKNIKGMEDSKRNWNFMNKLIWKTIPLETYTMMYKVLMDNDIDPWALNVEQEDAFGSFIYNLFKNKKVGDSEQELYFFNMLSTTSPSFIENKTQMILNKACQNYAIFESRIRYLYHSNPETFLTILTRKLSLFKDLPRSCDEYLEIKNLFQIIDQTMNNEFISKLPKIDFGDLCLSYADVVQKKINNQKEIKAIKDKTKLEYDKTKRQKLFERFNEITLELSEMKICWTDTMFHYFVQKAGNYPQLDDSLNLMMNIIHKKIDGIIDEYDKELSNVNVLCWRLESLVGFLAEMMTYDVLSDNILGLIQRMVSGDQIYSKLSTDIRFKLGLRFCAHTKKNTMIMGLLNNLVSDTSGSIYKFMLNDLLDRFNIPVIKEGLNEATNGDTSPFEHLSYDELAKTGLKEFIDDITYDIEQKFKAGFTEDQVSYRYITDIINLDCLTGKGEKTTFRDGHKKHIELLMLNNQINKLLSKSSLKWAQQKVRFEYKELDGMNNIRYIINNIGRILSGKIQTRRKN